ncbi:MAG: FkbM family methyltransferase [Acidobacteria bacterium]|nr:FkbM family methyltransferase [Acidobacteriota bacterium]
MTSIRPMPTMMNRLWNTSPASLTRALARRWGRLTARPGWHPVQAGPLAGAELFFDSLRLPEWRAMVAGTFDDFLYEALQARIRLNGAVGWDVGAHFGYHTLALAALGAQVVAFEPNALNAARLQENLARNSGLTTRVRLRPEALSDREGTLEFVQSADLEETSSGSHLAAATPPAEESAYARFQRVAVSSVRADVLIASGEPPPTVMKVDVEGAELLVLHGARELLRRHKPLLLVEVHHIRLMFHLRPLLEGCGYRLALLDETHAGPSRCFLLAE